MPAQVEESVVDPDRLRGPDLPAFAGIDPVVVGALPLEFAIAEKVQASQGWGAWPACTAKLGLR